MIIKSGDYCLFKIDPVDPYDGLSSMGIGLITTIDSGDNSYPIEIFVSGHRNEHFTFMEHEITTIIDPNNKLVKLVFSEQD